MTFCVLEIDLSTVVKPLPTPMLRLKYACQLQGTAEHLTSGRSVRLHQLAIKSISLRFQIPVKFHVELASTYHVHINIGRLTSNFIEGRVFDATPSITEASHRSVIRPACELLLHRL